MGSVLGSAVVERAGVLLEDQGFKSWTQRELLTHLNDGQLAIAALRPDAKTRVQSLQLVAGTRQSIAHPDLRLLDVSRNMGLSGAAPGRAIRFINRAELDLELPDWHMAAPSAVVRHWMYDQRMPETWWVYPPQPATAAKVEVLTSCVPTACTMQGIDDAAESTAIDLADIYVPPLTSYVVFRAFSKDAEYAQPGGKASLALNDFLRALGVKTETDKRFRPERSNPPLQNPPAPGNQGAFGDT